MVYNRAAKAVCKRHMPGHDEAWAYGILVYFAAACAGMQAVSPAGLQGVSIDWEPCFCYIVLRSCVLRDIAAFIVDDD